MFRITDVKSYLVALLVTFACCPFANGQANPQGANANALKTSSEERRLAKDFSKGKIAESAAAKAALQKVITAEMVKLTQPKELSRYATIRNTLALTYLSNGRPEAAPARKIIVDTVVRNANSILTRQSSPQSKINALALLAELDDAPASGAAPPRPALSALNTLYSIAKNENQPIYLRAIALHGLRRQFGAYWNAPNVWDQNQKRTVGMVLKSIVESKPKSELDIKGHAWLVRRAYDCLGVTRSTVVADSAIGHLIDDETLPSLRVAAADYLCRVDSRRLSAAQKSKYAIGLSHLLRSQLVHWYEHEEDLIKRAGGMTGGGYGMGMGMGMGMGYGGGEGMGAGYGGDGGEGMGYGMGMGGGEGMGMGYGGGTTSSKKKAIDVQEWQAIHARRRANQITQIIHTCLDGFDDAEGKRQTKLVGIPLVRSWTAQDGSEVADTPADLKSAMEELVLLVDAFQTAVNDFEMAPDTSKLLQQTKTPIEDIMDHVLTVPGFTDQYPDLAEDEELDEIPDQPQVPADNGGSGSEQPAGNAEGGEQGGPALEGGQPASGEGAGPPAGENPNPN